MEVGVDPAGEREQALVSVIPKLESRLRREDALTPLEQVVAGEGGRFFEYEGASSRLVAEGAFFVATQYERTAVLLVGSATNVIGAPGEQRSTLPVSGDPLRAIQLLLEAHGERIAAEELEDRRRVRRTSVEQWAPKAWENLAAEAWRVVMKAAPESARPRTRGVALYAGLLTDPTYAPGIPEALQKPLPGVDSLVLGSPVWIEQI